MRALLELVFGPVQVQVQVQTLAVGRDSELFCMRVLLAVATYFQHTVTYTYAHTSSWLRNSLTLSRCGSANDLCEVKGSLNAEYAETSQIECVHKVTKQQHLSTVLRIKGSGCERVRVSVCVSMCVQCEGVRG